MVFGARETAWPLIRADFSLSYLQIGVLLSAPNLFSNIVEPALGILSDLWRRRVLILGGGVAFGGSLLLAAVSGSFVPLLVAFLLLYPASGAFVSLSQAALMDAEPERREQNMARWTLAGSLGMVGGPLVLGAAVAAGAGWRGLFVGFAVVALILVLAAGRVRFPAQRNGDDEDDAPAGLREGLWLALRALKQREVARWLVLLQASDLMLDILYSLLALYFVDVVGVSGEQAGLAVAVWTGAGLVSDALIIPVLDHVRGLSILRISALLMAAAYPAFLVIPSVPVKIVLLGLMGVLNAGWYAILQAKLYDALPGRSGTALAVGNFAGLVGGLIPLGLGLAAQAAGLGATMWLLLAGPLALLIGLPRGRGEGDVME
ncbi:MFS transporter [Aggregatilinea sp.]|uniref:MFS transporter n=1 Tax=Aggregatilinea sp. TaxID=2806333 RepID=UPI002D1FC003|nr:MFS transporter [Aggregatilinea sp.]